MKLKRCDVDLTVEYPRRYFLCEALCSWWAKPQTPQNSVDPHIMIFPMGGEPRFVHPTVHRTDITQGEGL